MTFPPTQNHVVDSWLQKIESHASSNKQDDPNYYAHNPRSLISTSNLVGFSVGNGDQIISSIIPVCLRTRHELILVTCFWAKSKSQEAISSMLRKLSAKAIAENRKIQVRICFSSRSIYQKLFQTSSLDGKTYAPSSWPSLGLPEARDLEGLKLVVKSVFVRPFSVMHPKFILVDRQLAFLPSCNVSWESWFEGCIEMRGGICKNLFDFWEHFWSRGGAQIPSMPQVDSIYYSSPPDLPKSALISSTPFNSTNTTPTILLPSPHHMNPHFGMISSSRPSPTPLNMFLLEIILTATRSIFMQTPNLTCRPVINTLFGALERGVDITIITSTRLMILEQLVTAGTVTEFEVWKLIRRYRRLLSERQNSRQKDDPERQLQPPGKLNIGYYHPRAGLESPDEPIKSHLKITVVDESVVVLGSGNMDRASWYTSQELGVALFGEDVASNIKECIVNNGLVGRISLVCGSIE